MREPRKSLSGKVAVVTGANSGIGKRIAELFAAEGAETVLLVRNLEVGAQLVKEIVNNGGVAKAIYADLVNENEVKQAIDQTIKEYNAVDILVNCAGIFQAGRLTDMNDDAWEKIMNVNVNGAMYCMKYVLGYMLSIKSGSIINIASEAGISAIPNQVAYNVSKAALIMLTKSAARDYALDGVRINCVCPGRVITPLVQKLIDNSPNPDKKFRELSEDRPMKHMGTVDDIANACLMFATDSVSYATGSVLTVDGGYTL